MSNEKIETILRATEQILLVDTIKSEIKRCGIDHTFEILDKYEKILSEYADKEILRRINQND